MVCYSYIGFAQSSASNQGREFWTAYMSHIEDNGPSIMSLYITGDANTIGKVEIADGSSDPIDFSVTAGNVTIVKVPRAAYLVNTGQYLKGIHITAQKKIAVYAHIYSQSVSGATLLLPVSVLGKSYYSINYTQASNARSATFSVFTVVATEDNTTVEITPSQNLIDGKPAGTPFQIILRKGEVYQGMSFTDLTSTKIRSVSTVDGECKKIAVFSGSTKIAIGCNDGVNFTSDNLFQQVYPTASWGKNYITVPLKDRNYDIFRVVLSDPATRISINGNVISPDAIQAGHFYEFNSNQVNNIVADKPVQVVQYAVSFGKTQAAGCQFDPNDKGDPEMIYLNPLEQILNHVTLYSPSANAITDNYINVVIKADKASTFRVDGEPYNAFKAIPNNLGYAYAQIRVGSGTHNISADEGFNAIAYGFGHAESYGYSAGTNLKDLSEYINFIDPVTNTTQTNGCSGIPYKLQLVLSYQTTQIKWNFNDGSDIQVFDNPVAIPFQKDGKTLYRYDYPDGKLYTQGTYNFTATVINPVADECGSTKDIDIDFVITDFPKAAFELTGNLCSATKITLHDKTVAQPGSVSKIKIWWDYINKPDEFEVLSGDAIATDNNYYHTYDYTATTATYTVKMIVYTGEGDICDNGYESTVIIKGSPKVSLSAVKAICRDAGPLQLVADNHGFAGNGTFSGNGVNTTGLFDPAISGAGTFNITYHFVAANGCDAFANIDVTVNPMPVINLIGEFTLLEGESKVLPAKATGDNLTYEWSPAAGLDNINTLNPVTSVIADTRYKLLITNSFGCIASGEVFVKVLKKPVVVNAFTPNGDGINDSWNIKYLESYPGNTVDVYNRQGEKVYSSVGYAIPWDGRYKGSVLPAGVYYYIINPKNGRKAIAGNVTIIK
ncbi:T9SS type B sorting domain-containing protein [Mucilaginibacter phyllosphaerae]